VAGAHIDGNLLPGCISSWQSKFFRFFMMMAFLRLLSRKVLIVKEHKYDVSI
jgi:hypothetical protein